MGDNNTNFNGYFGGIFSDNSIYSSEINNGPTAGTEKNYDAMDEKVAEEDIRRIPNYQIIKRLKALRVYVSYRIGLVDTKYIIKKNKLKLAEIEYKLNKYAHYPDDVFGRDKLINNKKAIALELNKHEKVMTDEIIPKLRIYGKALGFKRLEDSAFQVKVPEDEVNNMKENSRALEEKVEQENKETLTNSISAIDKEVEKAREEQKKVNNVQNEKLRELYEKYSEIYGEEQVKRIWNETYEKVLQQKLEEELSEMDIKDILEENNNDNSVVKK